MSLTLIFSRSHWSAPPVGGGLTDLLHYDNDSILTLVVLLNHEDDYDGGVFRTNESDGRQLEHPLRQGDAVCFVSHKYHNVTPLTRGCGRGSFAKSRSDGSWLTCNVTADAKQVVAAIRSVCDGTDILAESRGQTQLHLQSI